MEDALLLNMIPQTHRDTPLGSSPNIPIKSNLSKLRKEKPSSSQLCFQNKQQYTFELKTNHIGSIKLHNVKSIIVLLPFIDKLQDLGNGFRCQVFKKLVYSINIISVQNLRSAVRCREQRVDAYFVPFSNYCNFKSFSFCVTGAYEYIFVYTRISEPQHQCFWLDNSLLWRIVLCVVGYSATIASTHEVSVAPLPQFDN